MASSLTLQCIDNLCSRTVSPDELASFDFDKGRVSKSLFLGKLIGCSQDQITLYEKFISFRDRNISHLSLDQIKQLDQNLAGLASRVGIRHMNYDLSSAALQFSAAVKSGKCTDPDLRKSRAQEFMQLKNGHGLSLDRFTMEKIDESLDILTMDRANLRKIIIATVSNSFDEDRVGVCSILFSKFECTEAEKKHIVDTVICYEKMTLAKETKQLLEFLKNRSIPKYSEAPEKIQREADRFLAAAGERLSYKFASEAIEKGKEAGPSSLADKGIN